MTECFNTEFKELLPELAADALAADVRARVQQHVASCEACAEELEILRQVRNAVIPAPYINVSRIVRSLPPAPVRMPEEVPWYRRASFQMAAAFLLVAGGLVAVRQAGDRAEAPRVAAVADQSMAAAPSVAAPEGTAKTANENLVSAPSPAVAPAAPKNDIALVAGLDEMSTQELNSLMQVVDEMAAVPVAEPEEFSPVSSVTENQGEG